MAEQEAGFYSGSVLGCHLFDTTLSNTISVLTIYLVQQFPTLAITILNHYFIGRGENWSKPYECQQVLKF